MYVNKRWFIYRKVRKGRIIDIKQDNRMLFPWLFGWKLFKVVDYSIPERKKEVDQD